MHVSIDAFLINKFINPERGKASIPIEKPFSQGREKG
jgi:hypothetical protein